MSDPQPARLKPRPRRAEPLQPDVPGSGDSAAPTPAESADPAKVAEAQEEAETAKLLEQARTAHENTRDGYG